MGKTTNMAVQARERARARRLALETDRKAQEDRIDEATAEVIIGQDEMAAAQTTQAAEVAAAQTVFDLAVVAAATKAAAVAGKVEPRIRAALGKLVAEKLSATRIAELTELSQADVRRLTKQATPADTAKTATAPPPAAAVAQPVPVTG